MLSDPLQPLVSGSAVTLSPTSLKDLSQGGPGRGRSPAVGGALLGTEGVKNA